MTSHGNEEANEEYGDDEEDEDECVPQRAPESRSERLRPLLLSNLIIFLVPEICEGNNQQTEERIEGVEKVVDNAESVRNIVHFVLVRPILASAQFRACSTRD